MLNIRFQRNSAPATNEELQSVIDGIRPAIESTDHPDRDYALLLAKLLFRINELIEQQSNAPSRLCTASGETFERAIDALPLWVFSGHMNDSRRNRDAAKAVIRALETPKRPESERELFEACISKITAPVWHAFSFTRHPNQNRYLEKTTELCFQTWLAARAFEGGRPAQTEN